MSKEKEIESLRPPYDFESEPTEEDIRRAERIIEKYEKRKKRPNMFYMKIEHQLNLNDRTLLSGKPTYDSVPEVIETDDIKFKVMGISSGVKPPYVSLEIEKTDLNLTGKEIRAC